MLHIITSLGSGGAERMLTRIACFDFGANGPVQSVMSLMDRGIHGETLAAAGVQVVPIGMQRGPGSLLAVADIVKHIRRIRPDVVMTWLYHADLIGTWAAKMAGVRRIIWNLRNSEIEFSRYAPTTKWTAALLARMSHMPETVACNSQAGRQAHERLGYHPRRWAYLPNGFDVDEWRPGDFDRRNVRSELGLTDSDFALGMIARVDPQKDHATLLAAAEQVSAVCSTVRFVLIGRGTEQLPLPGTLSGRVIRLGERRDVARLLRGLDAAVLSSAFGEGFPNALGEAMATGLPCVATDVGDSAALVGDAGLVVPPRDAPALAAAIGTIAWMSPDARGRLGVLARQRIEGEFAIDAIAAKYRNLWTGCDVNNGGG